ncbi:hypothetical protein FACS189418_0800 [Clostridia bacterium]|nr:hypothetical protein FACS189418_0800 [Clostridia bacterium]
MKISCITYHGAYNYGSVLQTFATVQYFRQLGFDIEIINYTPSHLRHHGSFFTTYHEISLRHYTPPLRIFLSLIKIFSYQKQLDVFWHFLQKYIPLTKPYPSIESLKKSPPQADLYCTGSDQVWNNYFTEKFDSAYFLDFLPEQAKKISFSASFGKENFDQAELKFIQKKLKKYRYLSVRENSALRILSEIGYQGDKILDPTLLLEADAWKKLSKKRKVKGAYLLVYQLHADSKALDMALAFKKMTGIPVIRIATMYHQRAKSSRKKVLPEVENFLGYFRYAAYIFTDSFHGVAFSLQFNRNFYVTLPSKFSDRILTILQEVNLSNRILDDPEDLRKIPAKISYQKVNRLLQKSREESKASFNRGLKDLHCGSF